MSNEEKKVSSNKTEKISEKKSVKKTNSDKSKKSKSSVKKNVKKSAPNKKVEDVIDNSITLEEADSFYHISLLAQAVCVIGVLAISVLAIFENSFTVPIEVLVGITLLIMAYNNVKLFKRRGLTVVYIVFGIISLIIGILGYFGVTI